MAAAEGSDQKRTALDLFLETHCPLPHALQRLVELGPIRVMQENRTWFAKMWQLYMQASQQKGLDLSPSFLLLYSVREPLNEAVACYVLGRFLGSVAMAATAVELALGSEVRERNVDIERMTLGDLIQEAERIKFVQKGSTLAADLRRLNKLRIDALHFSDIKKAKKMTKDLFQRAMGTSGPSTINYPPYEGPLRVMARSSIRLMDKIIGDLWANALSAFNDYSSHR